MLTLRRCLLLQLPDFLIVVDVFCFSSIVVVGGGGGGVVVVIVVVVVVVLLGRLDPDLLYT